MLSPLFRLLYFSAPVNPLLGAPIEILAPVSRGDCKQDLLLLQPSADLLLLQPSADLLLAVLLLVRSFF